MHDEERLAAAVDEVLEPVVAEVWAPIGEQVRALYADLDLASTPWSVEELVELVRNRGARRER